MNDDSSGLDIFLHLEPIYRFLPLVRQFVEGVEDRADYKRKPLAARIPEGKEGQV
jgi:hypothetical protein